MQCKLLFSTETIHYFPFILSNITVNESEVGSNLAVLKMIYQNHFLSQKQNRVLTGYNNTEREM